MCKVGSMSSICSFSFLILMLHAPQCQSPELRIRVHLLLQPEDPPNLVPTFVSSNAKPHFYQQVHPASLILIRTRILSATMSQPLLLSAIPFLAFALLAPIFFNNLRSRLQQAPPVALRLELWERAVASRGNGKVVKGGGSLDDRT